MNAAARLTAFGAGLIVAFSATYAAAAAFAPDRDTTPSPMPHDMGHHTTATQELPAGLSLGRDGYVLSPVTAPDTVGRPGQLSFSIVASSGLPLRDFRATHHKALHLVVLRSDGSHFAHVHPTLDPATGVWSAPWQWNAAGTYRVFADFQAADLDNAPAVTLSRTVDVAGDFTPAPDAAVRRVDEVDGFTVALQGDPSAGESSMVTATVTRGGLPVTALEPYLGAFGHLVALREGDLAFLHMHPMGAEPTAGHQGGPQVPFMAEVPTAGRYLLYLDFQVGGQVHTAHFVLDAAAPQQSAAMSPHPQHRR